MTDNSQETLELCNKAHSIMQDATKSLPIPAPEQARDARKKLSVFTYGIFSELTVQSEIDVDVAYEQYLRMGGLSIEQANTIVTRTRDEFTNREFGELCFKSGKNAVIQWLSGDKNIQPLVEALL